MTRDESLTVLSMILSHWPVGREWSKEEIDAYARGIQDLDPEVATHTVIRAQKEIKYRPALAEFREYYRAEKRRLRPQVEAKGAPETTPLPMWVKRWMCARLLYSQFGKARDLRRFPEQQDFGDLTQELMPEGAWVEEAESLEEKGFHKAFERFIHGQQ